MQPLPSGDYDSVDEGFRARVVGFDFATKKEHALALNGIEEATDSGLFVWIDIDVMDAGLARSPLTALKMVDPMVVNGALCDDPATSCARYEDYWHLVLSGCLLRGEELSQQRLDVVMAEKFLLTIHRGKVHLLDKVMRDYQQDFRLHAKSPSFMLYELWDSLIESFHDVEQRFENRVHDVQRELMQKIDDRIFGRVSRLSNDLMEFRGVLRPALAVLSELSTRKNRFVSEATQATLVNMVPTVERTLQDVLAAREMLTDSLNLHMSMVAYRTNEGVNKLTAVNMIFLPLTFLCGMYGMNFDVMPELRWTYGYGYFWIAVVIVVVFLTVLMRRMKML